MFGILWRSYLHRARKAARSKKWVEAVTFYRKHLDRNPHDALAWVQLGHGLKELGELHEASTAYCNATEIMPEYQDGWIYLARVECSLGHRENAVMTLSKSLVATPCADQVISEMLAMGERNRLPLSVQAMIEEKCGHYSSERYGAYHAAWCSPNIAEGAGNHPDILPVIDARGVKPELIDVTQSSLLPGPCLILTDVVEPTASEWLISGERLVSDLSPVFTHLLLIKAGSRLALGMVDPLRKAMDRTGAGAAYCDHDHWEALETGIVMRDPCFQPMHDPIWFQRAEIRPPCMMVAREVVGAKMQWGELFSNRMSLSAIYAHVPLVLASRPINAASSPVARPMSAGPGGGQAIQVIIQTRDKPELLERCIASLVRTAAHPGLLDILIMDNRSILPDTAALLESWTEQGIVRSQSHDEPFNWAKANNVAVRLGHAPHLLFLNNDVEMESMGWDLALRDYLAQEKSGALGALLLYPNRAIQHAGVVFGMGTGGPVHEGVGRVLGPGGPNQRWRYPRLASAVTGAWLATSRDLFGAVGGFDESLAVAYNDIDFCLRCRAADKFVLQASDIVAMHRESATRGTTMSPSEYARDQEEWSRLRVRWGEALDLDPAYNPHWVRTGRPFDGFSKPTDEMVAHWVDASARQNPWSI